MKARWMNSPCILSNASTTSIVDAEVYDIANNTYKLETYFLSSSANTTSKSLFGNTAVNNYVKCYVKTNTIWLRVNSADVDTGVYINNTQFYKLGIILSAQLLATGNVVIELNDVPHLCYSSSWSAPISFTGMQWTTNQNMPSNASLARYFYFRMYKNNVEQYHLICNNKDDITTGTSGYATIYDCSGNGKHLTLTGNTTSYSKTTSYNIINSLGFNIINVSGIDRRIPQNKAISTKDVLGNDLTYVYNNNLLPCIAELDFINGTVNTGVPSDLASFNMNEQPTSYGTRFFYRNNTTSNSRFYILTSSPAKKIVAKVKNMLNIRI